MPTFERRPVATLVVIGACFALIYLVGVLAVPSRTGRIINGDAIQYFAYLQSIAADGDLDFTNDYLRLYANNDPETNVWLRSRTPAGRPPNMMSVGPAILWSPFYLTARAILGTPPGGSREEAWLLASVGLAGVFYATLGACLTFMAAARLCSRRAAFWATLLVWLGGPAVYYSTVSPAYSHAASMCVVAAFVYAWIATRGRVGWPQAILLGALGGLVALVRWQDAILLLLPGGDWLAATWSRERRVGALVRDVALMTLTAAIVFVPQNLAWNAVYGSPITIPQGAGFMKWTAPEVLNVLFSLRHGLFSWTPVMLAAVVGLSWLVRRDRRLGWLVVIAVALAIYVNAAVWDWWAGEAYGARRFTGIGVLFALGLAALLDTPAVSARPRAAAWLSIAAIGYNLLFVLQYQLFMRGMRDLVPYPSTVQQVFVDRLWLPFELLARWWAG